MAALMWISHSERPPNVDEICHALAVEIGSGFTLHGVVEWQDDMAYFREFGNSDQVAIFRESFIHNSLRVSGSVLLENGYELRLVSGFFAVRSSLQPH